MGSGRGDSVTKTGSNGEIISLHGEQVCVRQACSRVIGGWWQAMRRNTSAGPCSGPATWQEMQLCMCPSRPASSPGPSAAWVPIDALLPPQSGCAVALPLPSGLPQLLGKQAPCAHLRHCRPSAPSQRKDVLSLSCSFCPCACRHPARILQHGAYTLRFSSEFWCPAVQCSVTVPRVPERFAGSAQESRRGADLLRRSE